MKALAFVILLFTADSAYPAAFDWPQWRGPNRDGHAAPGSPVPDKLPSEVKPLWRLEIGGGFSSPIVAADTLYYLDEADGQEVAHAVDASTGREKWRLPYAAVFEDEWGKGPRSTPMVDGERLYVQACNGEFRCLRATDGKVLWQTSFEKDFGVKFLGSKANEGTASRRGNNGSGVIDGNRLILPVGGQNRNSLVAFDKLTGKVLWQTGNDEAAYSSFVVASFAGTRQVLAFTAEALLGANLENGDILWRVPYRTGAKRHAATPVVIGDCVTVNSHTIGLICLSVSRTETGWQAKERWANRSLKINLATPVLVGGCLYSVGTGKNFVCVDAATGEIKWSAPNFGSGNVDYIAVIAIGSRLLALVEDGQLVLLEASPQSCKELGRLQVCGKTWSHPAYANGRLFVRDRRQLLCLELAAPKS